MDCHLDIPGLLGKTHCDDPALNSWALHTHRPKVAYLSQTLQNNKKRGKCRQRVRYQQKGWLEGMLIGVTFFQINIYICLFNVESSVVYLFNLGSLGFDHICEAKKIHTSRCHTVYQLKISDEFDCQWPRPQGQGQRTTFLKILWMQ